ncbi:hypothetical protein AAC387_Pa08g0899 [Persea americana]
MTDEIVEAVRMFKPRSLREAIELARLHDDNLSKQKRSPRGAYQQRFQPFKSVSRASSSTTVAVSNSQSIATTSAKKLSWDEMQRRREKGLCFGCNKKFTLCYRCQQPQAFFIEAFSQEDLFNDLDVHEDEVDDEDTGGPLISLHAILRCMGPRIMRVYW